jgi:hypothetical protein
MAAVSSSVSDVMDFVEYVFNGPWHEGLFQRIKNSKRFLHNFELHRDVRPLYKHLELWHCPDMFFFQPMCNNSLRNASCKHTAEAVFWHALHCTVWPESPHTAEPCVKMKPENTEIKLLFIWLVFWVTLLPPGELLLWQKLFTMCCVGYNILVK